MSSDDSDVDNLTSRLNTTFTPQSSRRYHPYTPHTIHHLAVNSNSTEMVPPQPIPAVNPQQIPAVRDFNELRFRLSAINNYNGSPDSLNNYIFSCRQVTDNYDNSSPQDKALIICHLKAKLTDRASLQLGTRNYNSFELYYEDLRQSFSLGKDLNSYRSDILNACKKSTQPLIEFAYDIRKLLDLAYDFVQSSNYPQAEVVTIKRELDCIAIEKIIASCHHDLQRHFFSKTPLTVADTINEIQRDIAFTQRAKQNSTYFSYTNPQKLHNDYKPPPRPLHPLQSSHRNLPPLPQRPVPQPVHRQNLPPKPAFQNNFRPNAQHSGRYANSNVFRNNSNQYPRPPTFNNNSPMYNPSNRPPHYASTNNNFRSPFNNSNFNKSAPPRPTTQHPPTPMDVNSHEYDQQDYYDPYEQVDQEYYEPSYDNFYDPSYNYGNNDPYFDENVEEHFDQNQSHSSEPINFTKQASENITNNKTQ